MVERADRRPAWRRNRQNTWIGLAVLALAALLLAIGAYWYLSNQEPPSGRAGSIVLEASGDSDEVTDPFFVREGWQIHWETEGERFAYTIRGDMEFGTVVDREGPGSGITSPVPSGNFYIQVTAEGPWSILVLQGD